MTSVSVVPSSFQRVAWWRSQWAIGMLQPGQTQVPSRDPQPCEPGRARRRCGPGPSCVCGQPRPGRLGDDRMAEVCAALAVAVDCD